MKIGIVGDGRRNTPTQKQIEYAEYLANRMKCCDNCIFYEWYYDRCKRWMCFINDPRSVCSFWLERPTIKKAYSEARNEH